MLWELNQNQGRSLVIVLHDLNLACRYADYLVAVNEGNIYTQGKPQDVVNEKMLLDVFGLKFQIVPDPVSGTPMCVPISKKDRIRN